MILKHSDHSEAVFVPWWKEIRIVNKDCSKKIPKNKKIVPKQKELLIKKKGILM